MLKPLTTLELKLIHLVEEDCKRTNLELAKILKIPEADVENLLHILEEDKIILKYRAIVNWEKIESPEVVALIQVTVTPSQGEGYDEVARKISNLEEVSTCMLVSGSFDLLVEVGGPSLKDVAFFVADKLATIAGVEHTRTNFLLKRYKEGGDIFSGSEKTHRLPVMI
ncbi:MAG: Lrp/AsnC family transcriptional regulator [Spirochaetia bacterium]|nr:Lrp/AsnC family transcriptional regulator [Spirochaetia bacterium]